MIECNSVEGKSIINNRVVFSLLLLLLIFLVLAIPRVAWSEVINFEPPGQLIDVDGRTMHINCIGNKSPSIILDSGAGGFSLEWGNIQKSLSQYARVCAYDRAGYGWSDMGLLPRTTKRITYELHTLLQNAGIHGPYILVGHSFGGFTAQYFARNFGDEIVGIVLIDSSHEEQVYRLPENGKDVVRRSLHQDRSNMFTQSVIHEHYPEEEAALAEHSDTLEDYNKSSAELLKKYSIDNPAVKDKYRQLIDSLFDKN